MEHFILHVHLVFISWINLPFDIGNPDDWLIGTGFPGSFAGEWVLFWPCFGACCVPAIVFGDVSGFWGASLLEGSPWFELKFSSN